MKPVKHEGCNTIIAENQPEYFDLPSFKSHQSRGDVITCWKLSWKERLCSVQMVWVRRIESSNSPPNDREGSG